MLKFKIKNLLLPAVFLLGLAVSGCSSVHTINKGSRLEHIPAVEISPDTVELNILCAGDIMAHMPQINSAQTEQGGYDFTENYAYVKPILQNSDLAICNIEFTFAGKPYSGYPSFSAPGQIAEAVKDAGFDIAATANNHSYDKGLKGIKRTIETLYKAGLIVTGTVKNKNDKKYAVVEANGVKIAVIAATYESPEINGKQTINGRVLDKKSELLINTFNYKTLDEDLKNFKDYANEAKKDGAEIVIFFLHWGNEYETTPNAVQKEIAEKTALLGADIIFGSHPHVLQTYEILIDTETGKKTPVFYSLGNFISNQRAEILKMPGTEYGMIAAVKIVFDKDTRKIADISADYIPTWTDKYHDGSRYVYHIVPLTGDFAENEPLITSGHAEKAKKALESITNLFDTSAKQ